MEKRSLKKISAKFYYELWVDTPYWLIAIYILNLSSNFDHTITFDEHLWLGACTFFISLISSTSTSLCRNIPSKFKFIPPENRRNSAIKYIFIFLRVFFFTVVIATFATIYELTTQAFFYPVYLKFQHLLPTTIVNCQVLGRFGSFSIRNNVKTTFMDGIYMGIGFILFLILSSVASNYLYQIYPRAWVPPVTGIMLLSIIIFGAKAGLTKAMILPSKSQS